MFQEATQPLHRPPAPPPCTAPSTPYAFPAFSCGAPCKPTRPPRDKAIRRDRLTWQRWQMPKLRVSITWCTSSSSTPVDSRESLEVSGSPARAPETLGPGCQMGVCVCVRGGGEGGGEHARQAMA